MPTVNIYSNSSDLSTRLSPIIPELKSLIAKKLSSKEIELTHDEISIRFIKTSGGEMIGDTEIEISAASFPERVKKQDQICLDIMNYIKGKELSVGSVKVWLKLSELGHSWK